MSREVRRVPPHWMHPKNEKGDFIPLREGGDYQQHADDWDAGHALWQQGLVECYGPTKHTRPKTQEDGDRFTEWDGPRPSPDDYMPAWAPEDATHLMMYEDTSEGTPISPAFATPEELARWLADTGASSFGDMTASYEQWLSVARGGWAPSMVISDGVMVSGVEFAVDPTEEKS